ncbi:hypothetical protein EV421DRAFT_1909477 [Armillaria borealis]|uniref:NAD(P)-binding protein n=1 Tax=Armillaria borealis TaxID=47425 RepID=A0AA39J1F7_9AGAR|nr:hypothetical protein EV421DRAFT_1909477 [Armillaria borealis]
MYMAARDETRAKGAIDRLNEEGHGPGLGEVIWHELDLKDPRSARESAERFIARERKLDILVNNTALIPAFGNVQALNPDGIWESMAVSYLGPYIFTKTLLPLPESTASLDGANVGSNGYCYAKYLEYGSKEAWNYPFKCYLLPSLQRYEYSKLALHLWTNNLARRLSEKRSKFVVITHPGIIPSDGAIRPLYSLPYPPSWIWLVGLVMHPQTTASVFAACAPRDNPEIFQGGHIYPPSIVVPQARAALDEDRQ